MIAKGFSSESHVAFSGPVYLASSKLGKFLNYFLDIHYLDTLEDYWPVILKNVLSIWVPLMFLVIRSRFYIFGRKVTEKCGVLLIVSQQVAPFWFVPLLVIFTLITWLSLVSVWFLHDKVILFLFKIIKNFM